MRVGSLFSGIGGLDLGLERAGMTVAWQSEINPYACRVLAKHWPDVKNLGDITTIDWKDVERVDLICGGYPCQPFSTSGHRRGSDDVRHLWPRFRDAIRILRPRYVLAENVAGHLSLGFDQVLADLAELGFDVEWSTVSACSMGAPHMRDRLYILAHAQGDRWDWFGDQAPPPPEREGGPLDRKPEGQGASTYWTAIPEPPAFGVAHGLQGRMDRDRLRALGNAVVPAVAEHIGRRLMAVST